MGPQCEDGYTKIANELLEALCRIRIPGEPMQIFLVILRKTYGYKKLLDRIALSQFVEATGMKKPNVCRSLKQLQTLNVIQIDKVVIQNDNGVIQNDNAYFITYRINKLYDTWEREKRRQSRKEPLSKRIITVIQNDNEPLSKTITTKEKKEKKEKKSELISCFEKLWERYPRKIGKPSAEKHFLSTVKTVEDARRVWKALDRYLEETEDTEMKYIKHGDAWFNKWQDWELTE